MTDSPREHDQRTEPGVCQHDLQEPMKTLIFGGRSDDTFGEITPRGDDYDNCASGEPIEYRIDSAEGSLIVFGQYCPGHAAGWVVGIAPVEGEGDAQEIPSWPIRIRRGARCYSPEMEIDVPEDATIRCLQREPSHD